MIFQINLAENNFVKHHLKKCKKYKTKGCKKAERYKLNFAFFFVKISTPYCMSNKNLCWVYVEKCWLKTVGSNFILTVH